MCFFFWFGLKGCWVLDYRDGFSWVGCWCGLVMWWYWGVCWGWSWRVWDRIDSCSMRDWWWWVGLWLVSVDLLVGYLVLLVLYLCVFVWMWLCCLGVLFWVGNCVEIVECWIGMSFCDCFRIVSVGFYLDCYCWIVWFVWLDVVGWFWIVLGLGCYWYRLVFCLFGLGVCGIWCCVFCCWRSWWRLGFRVCWLV